MKPIALLFALGCLLGPRMSAGDPVYVSSVRDARQLQVTWSAAGQPFLHAVVQRQFGSDPWADRDSVAADGAGIFTVNETPLHVGMITSLRLGWVDSLGTHVTPAVSDTVPAFQATSYAQPHSDGATVGWYVLPDAPGFAVRVERAPTTQGPWSTLQGFASTQFGWFQITDATRAPQSGCAYRLVLGDGFTEFASAPESVTTLAVPQLVSARANPAQAWLEWSAPAYDGGFAYGATMDTLASGYTGFAPDSDGHLRTSVVIGNGADPYFPNPAPQETLYVHLRWQEPDNSLHIGPWIAVLPERAIVDSAGVSVHTGEVISRWQIMPRDSSYTVTLLALSASEEVPTPWILGYKASLRAGADFTTYRDTSLAPGSWFAYQVSYLDEGILRYGPVVTGWSASVPGQTYALTRPDGVRLIWFLKHGAGFTATLERRVDGGPWATLRNVVAGGDTLVATDATVVEGHLYGYRLSWFDGVSQFHTEIAETLQPVSRATLVSFDSRPHRIKTYWSAPTADPQFVWYIERATADSTAWDTLGVLGPEIAGERAFTDTTALAARQYRYRVAWTRGIGPAVSAEYRIFVRGDEVALGSAYPNPAHGSFSVAFTLPDEKPSTIALYDVHGRLRTSAPFQGPGAFTWSLARGAVEPGLYFVRLRSGEVTRTKRIVLLP